MNYFRYHRSGKPFTDEEMKQEEIREQENKLSRRLGTHTIYGQTAEQLASKVHDLDSLIITVRESLNELKFKKYEVVSIEMNFFFKNTGLGNEVILTVTLHTPYQGNYQYINPGEYSRFFQIGTRHDDLLSLFSLIESWKERLLRDHADKLKLEALPQTNLFGTPDKVKTRKKKT